MMDEAARCFGLSARRNGRPDSLLPQTPLRRPFPLWTRCGRKLLVVYDRRDQAVAAASISIGQVLKQCRVSRRLPQSLRQEQVRWFAFHQIRILAPASASDAQLQRMAVAAPRECNHGVSRTWPPRTSESTATSGTVFLQRARSLQVSVAGTEVCRTSSAPPGTAGASARSSDQLPRSDCGRRCVSRVSADLTDVPTCGRARRGIALTPDGVTVLEDDHFGSRPERFGRGPPRSHSPPGDRLNFGIIAWPTVYLVTPAGTFLQELPLFPTAGFARCACLP